MLSSKSILILATAALAALSLPSTVLARSHVHRDQGHEAPADAHQPAVGTTTIVLTKGVTTTLELPIPEQTTAAWTSYSSSNMTTSTTAAPVIVTAAAGQLVCERGAALGLAVACGLGLLGL